MNYRIKQKTKSFHLIMNIFMLIPLLIVLLSCEGTIQQTSKPKNQSVKVSSTSIQFAGIKSATAISDSRIEITFPSATGGSGKFIYRIYVSGLSTPISKPQDTLFRDYTGYLRYTIKDLKPATGYIIKVNALEEESETEFESDVVSSSVTLFENKVATFNGVSQVLNNTGAAGLDSFTVYWSHAKISSNIFGDSSTNPLRYEITIIDGSTSRSPADMNNTELGVLDGRIVRQVDFDENVVSFNVTGLKSNTLYYVQMRAIHNGSVEDPLNLRLRGEQNTHYLEIRTYSNQSSSLQFDPEDMMITENTGAFSNSSKIISWEAVTGAVFDHYRVYVAEQPSAFNPINAAYDGESCSLSGAFLSNPSSVYCKKVAATSNLTTISGLALTEKNYDVYLTVCLDVQCQSALSKKVLYAQKEIIDSNSVTASFSGVTSLGLAKSEAEIGTVKLNYTIPTFQNGFFDGIVVAHKLEQNSTYDYIGETGYTGDFHVDDFNYIEDSFLVVRGLEYSSTSRHCFKLYPFIYRADGSKNIITDSRSPFCSLLLVRGPTASEFSGFNTVKTVGEQIIMTWDLPTSGVYSHYEIFYLKNAASKAFNFTQAIQESFVDFDNTNYERILFHRGDDPETQFYSIDGLDDGIYKVGILTYYVQGVVGISRSEANLGVYTCEVDHELTVQVDCDLGN